MLGDGAILKGTVCCINGKFRIVLCLVYDWRDLSVLSVKANLSSLLTFREKNANKYFFFQRWTRLDSPAMALPRHQCLDAAAREAKVLLRMADAHPAQDPNVTAATAQ